MMIEIKTFNDEEATLPSQIMRAGFVTWWHSITRIGLEHGYFYRDERFLPRAAGPSER